MPDYIQPGFTDPSNMSGLYKALMERLNKPEDELTRQEADDTFYDAAKIGGQGERVPINLENNLMLHPLRGLGLAKPALPDLPPQPSTFLPEPLVVGQPDTARIVHQLLQHVPDLKRGLNKKIVLGNTEGANRMLEGSNFEPHQYETTNLLGVFDRKNGDISINPSLQLGAWEKKYNQRPAHDPKHLVPTLAHELMHNRGWMDDVAYKTQEMVPQPLLDYLRGMQEK